MRIKKITSQSRRDFIATFVCEHCDHEQRLVGYDDDNFHRNVVPKLECPECGKQAPPDFSPLTPMHQESKSL